MRKFGVDGLAMAALLLAGGRRAGRTRQRIEVKKVAIRVSGSNRNLPCPCGSGVKAKKCPCETYEA